MSIDLSVKHYTIAGFRLQIDFKQTKISGDILMPSLSAFRMDSGDVAESDLLLKMTVNDNLPVVEKKHRQRIRRFDTGNGETIVDLIDNGGYQFIIKDTRGKECALLISNKEFTVCQCALNGNTDMRRFGMNNALMLAFAFASCTKDTLLIHASSLRHNNLAYAFTAESGTGKSTHVNLWLQNIPNCDLINDDNPVIRITGGRAYLFGSPWSGKTPCYRNTKVPLGAIILIDRAQTNSIEKLSPLDAFTTLITACSMMKWDKDIFNHVSDTIIKVIKTTDIYTLHCLPNKEAATLCHKTIAK